MAEPRLTPRALSAPSTAEPPPQELPLPLSARRRELVARLGLVAADLLAVCSSMLIVAELSGATFTVWAVALLPLYALLAKAGGLYDRDQFILHKTTLDEAPTLLAVAALFTIVDRSRSGAGVHRPLPSPAAVGPLGGHAAGGQGGCPLRVGARDGQRTGARDRRRCRIQPDQAQVCRRSRAERGRRRANRGPGLGAGGLRPAAGDESRSCPRCSRPSGWSV